MNKLKKNKGFTLIELLVALSIVGIILLSFFKVIDNTTKINVKNDIDIKALKLAKSEIENLRNNIKNKTLSENTDINNIIQNEKEVSNESIKPYIKSIDGKEFQVSLNIISKSKVYAQNKTLDTGLYMYKINIKVEACDTYFSRKSAELNDIEILSKNS